MRHLIHALVSVAVLIACYAAQGANSLSAAACDPVKLADISVNELSFSETLSFFESIDEKTYNSKFKTGSASGSVLIDKITGEGKATWKEAKSNARSLKRTTDLNIVSKLSTSAQTRRLNPEAAAILRACLLQANRVALTLQSYSQGIAQVLLEYEADRDISRDGVAVKVSQSSNVKPGVTNQVEKRFFNSTTAPLFIELKDLTKPWYLAITVGGYGDSLLIPGALAEQCAPPVPTLFKTADVKRTYGGRYGLPNPYVMGFDERMFVTKVSVYAHDRIGRVANAKLMLHLDDEGPVDKGLKVSNTGSTLVWEPKRTAGHIRIFSKEVQNAAGDDETHIIKVDVEGYPVTGPNNCKKS